MYRVEEYLSIIDTLIKDKSTTSSSKVDKHGLLLYYFSLYQAFEHHSGREQIQSLIGQTLRMLLSEEENLSEIVISFPILKELAKEGFIDRKLEKKIAALDTRLLNQASNLLESGNLDLLGGATGILNYYVERMPNASIENYINKLLPQFNETLMKSSLLTSGSKTLDLGISQGLAGSLLVLIKAQKMNVKSDSLIRIIRKGILQILKFKEELDFTQKRYCIFPNYINLEKNSATFSNQLSWSSSDLNQALLFYRAFELFKDVELKKMADLVGLNTLLRKDNESTSITDSHFDQGSSGVAQIYKTLYHIANHRSYQAGYEFWINRTMELVERELKMGFYTDREYAFSHGLTGVALTLISYAASQHENRELSWSNCFLL